MAPSEELETKMKLTVPVDLVSLAKLILSPPECRSISILTGAGVSVLRGFPTFDLLWACMTRYDPTRPIHGDSLPKTHDRTRPDPCHQLVRLSKLTSIRISNGRDFFARGDCDLAFLDLTQELGWIEDVQAKKEKLPLRSVEVENGWS